MATYAQLSLARIAEAAARRSTDPTRHTCFVSYHHEDQDEVEEFLDTFGHVFIARVLGVSDEDDFVDSDNTDYIMDYIREVYLTDSTVTIVMVGKGTWASRYVDWEVFSTLRNDKNNRRSGLMAITLPSAADYWNKQLPPRVADNVDADEKYARWWKYPTAGNDLQGFIDIAFDTRVTKAHLIDNTRERRGHNVVW